jgi:hypothetical protein
MFTVLDLKTALCETYNFMRSLVRIHDLILCVETGQTFEQVVERPTIYLCVSKQVNRSEVIEGFHNYFKESSGLNLLLGAKGELFECPKCLRKMTNLSFPAHLKNEHKFILIAVDYSTCADNLEKEISRSIKKGLVLPSEQIDILEDLLDSSTIKSLYHSATVGEKRKIRALTYRKFVNFENEINNAKRLNQDKNLSTLSHAISVQNAIRNAIKGKRIVVIKKKHKKKRRKNGLQIFSGGLPGLGKRN